jgi:hypothetical protein
MRLTALFVTIALLASTPAVGQSAFLDLSKPQTGTSQFVFDAVTLKPVQLGARSNAPGPCRGWIAQTTSCRTNS